MFPVQAEALLNEQPTNNKQLLIINKSHTTSLYGSTQE